MSNTPPFINENKKQWTKQERQMKIECEEYIFPFDLINYLLNDKYFNMGDVAMFRELWVWLSYYNLKILGLCNKKLYNALKFLPPRYVHDNFKSSIIKYFIYQQDLKMIFFVIRDLDCKVTNLNKLQAAGNLSLKILQTLHVYNKILDERCYHISACGGVINNFKWLYKNNCPFNPDSIIMKKCIQICLYKNRKEILKYILEWKMITKDNILQHFMSYLDHLTLKPEFKNIIISKIEMLFDIDTQNWDKNTKIKLLNYFIDSVWDLNFNKLLRLHNTEALELKTSLKNYKNKRLGLRKK